MMEIQTCTGQKVRLRKPRLEDGPSIHRLIQACPPLDLNSAYAYLLQTLHFAETCVLAEVDRQIAGYLSAYVPPGRPGTIFVWQIAVGEAWRGQGLGRLMLKELLARPDARNVAWLETTIGPSNLASRQLFAALARDLAVECRSSSGFGPELFDAAHETEYLFTVGPFTGQTGLPDAGHARS